MKTTLFKRKALAFLGAAAVLLAAVFTAGCANGTGDGATGGNSGSGNGSYVAVPFGELDSYLKIKASATGVNYIEVTRLTAADLKGSYNSNIRTFEPSKLGKILKDNRTKKVALKLGGRIEGLTDMSYCFKGCESLVQAPEIPAGVTNIADCFSLCTSLTQVPTIPASVTEIKSCFFRCTSLTRAPVILASITDMRSCFRDCTNLTQVPTIPDGVTDMRTCFYNCTSLKQAPEIPVSVTTMALCFSGCTKLEKAVLKCNYNPAEMYGRPAFKDAFFGCTSLMKGSITVPKGQLLIYANNADTMGANAEWFASNQL